MERSPGYNRRKFLKLGVAAFFMFNNKRSVRGLNLNEDGEEGVGTGIGIQTCYADKPSKPSESCSPAEEDLTLKDYLDLIKEDKNQAMSFVAEKENVMSGIKKLSERQVMTDLDMYFPMYKAGEMEYGIDWKMLWIIHTHETAVSRDPNTYNLSFRGAMQRSYKLHPDEELATAAKKWEFLGELAQRYSDDWREILWAARFIKNKAWEIYPDLPESMAMLEVVENNYSAHEHGVARVKKYLELKEMFEKTAVKFSK